MDADPAFRWEKTEISLALVNHDTIVWKINFGPQDPKPSFYPLNTLDGVTLTDYRPDDHRWHRALWFSWKYINGLNYWEEDPISGKSEGVTQVTGIEFKLHTDFSAKIKIDLNYHPSEDPVLLSEERWIEISAPSTINKSYTIQWHSRFTSKDYEVFLDRTPIEGEPEGVPWGGYAGLSVRFSPKLVDWSIVDSEGRMNLEANQKHASWVHFSGKDPSSNRVGGIRIADQPGNPRHPTPWYVIMGQNPAFGYFSPAFLFFEPYTMKANSQLDLRYDILIHSGLPQFN